MNMRLLLVTAVLLLVTPAARATYSIAACDRGMRTCGVAVQTNNLAVGASVPYAKASVGAIASQFETNPMYGPGGLALLAAGKTPEDTAKQLLSEDGKTATADNRIKIADRLLEVGRPREALAFLDGTSGDKASCNVLLLKATAYSALGQSEEVKSVCRRILEGDAKETRLRLRCTRLLRGDY